MSNVRSTVPFKSTSISVPVVAVAWQLTSNVVGSDRFQDACITWRHLLGNLFHKGASLLPSEAITLSTPSCRYMMVDRSVCIIGFVGVPAGVASRWGRSPPTVLTA